MGSKIVLVTLVLILITLSTFMLILDIDHDGLAVATELFMGIDLSLIHI